MEQKLLGAVGNAWNTLLSQAQPDVEAIIEENFVPSLKDWNFLSIVNQQR